MNNMQKSFKRKSALRCMADGGAIYKSVGANGVPIFSDVASSGDPYTPGEQTPSLAPAPAPAPPPAARISPALPPPAAKISPLAIGPKSNLMANTGGFGPTPAPMSTYQKAGGAGTIGSTPSSIGANRAEIGANRTPIGAGSPPIGSMSAPIGANRAEIGARRQPIGAMGYPLMTTMASGGKVTGPGGPTEDKVPAMLSAGEYVLPADTVKKVGVQNLDALKDATHKPSGQSKLRGNVRKFADGDVVDKRLLSPQLTGTRELLQGQPMPPPPATKFVEVPPVPVEKSWAERGAEHQMAEWKASQVVPPGESPMGALGRNLRGVYRATTAPFRDYGDGSSLSTAVDKAAGQFTAGLTGEAPPSSAPKANEIGPPAPAPAPTPVPAPGAAPALPEGVTQRPDGIYQQGNSFSNVLGADGKPQFLQERVGPPSPASEAYLARTPEMQFGPIPSGPGSSLRGGRGGGMRLNMPSAQDTALRSINARFDKLAENYAKNADPMSPSKTARTMADLEQARTNALNGVMGNDTARRGQDIDKARTDATNAAGMAQEGLKGQFNLLGEAAARNAAAQKAQAERDLEIETGAAERHKALYADLGPEVTQAYNSNRDLIQRSVPRGTDGSINVGEVDRMSGNLHAVLKAAGRNPNSKIVDIVNTPDNGAEAGPTGSPWFDLTTGDAYEIKFDNGEVVRVKQSALKDNPGAESFIQNYQRRKAQDAKGAK